MDKVVLGQGAAKRALAHALRDQHRRRALSAEERIGLKAKHVLLKGQTGVGKSALVGAGARLCGAPVLKVNATEFTEIGYVGGDVQSIIPKLVLAAVEQVRREEARRLHLPVREMVLRQVAARLDPGGLGKTALAPEMRMKVIQRLERTRARGGQYKVDTDLYDHCISLITQGKLDDIELSIPVDLPPNLGRDGAMLERGYPIDVSEFPIEQRDVRIPIREAIAELTRRELDRRLDHKAMRWEAIRRTEQMGVVILDELDKIADRNTSGSPDISRQGVQRDLLPLLDGTEVATRFGPIRTDNILFVCCGAFNMTSPEDLFPELQGRLIVQAELSPLTEADFVGILRMPGAPMLRQYTASFATEGIRVRWEDAALVEIARVAMKLNRKGDDLGARQLDAVLSAIAQDISFDPTAASSPESVVDVARVARVAESVRRIGSVPARKAGFDVGPRRQPPG